MKNNLAIALLWGIVICAFAACADDSTEGFICEDELDVFEDLLSDDCNETVDLRTAFPVMREGDSALTGISYSARGWRLDLPIDDQTRMAEIKAVPGNLVGRVFTPSGTPATILETRQGEGTWTWELSSAPEKMVYQLTHVAKVSGATDESATCFGYFDFTRYGEYASQAQVEEAVLDPKTEPVATTQDAVNPWQPIKVGVAGMGIETDANLADGVLTTTAFAFQGRGTFRFEYTLGGGTLVATVDGVPQTLTAAADWQSMEIPFEEYGVHTVSFTYTAAGAGGTAALRRVCWEVPWSVEQIGGDCTDVRVDLREGPVRSPARMEHVLPFAYSSTNWIGGVSGATASSAAKVTIVQLTGTDPDVTKWTADPGKPLRVLHDAAGEGEVKWKPKKGVWKATFDILGTSHHEESFFDLRESRAPGMAVILF